MLQVARDAGRLCSALQTLQGAGMPVAVQFTSLVRSSHLLLD